MSVAPGLLDRRLYLYTRTDAGADGFARPVYEYTGQWWGRIDAVSDRQVMSGTPMAHSEYRTKARATVADYVPVPLHGAIKIDGVEPVYMVRGVTLRRVLRCQVVELEEIDPTESVEFVGFEGLSTLDGMHFVQVTNGFSTGFDAGFAS